VESLIDEGLVAALPGLALKNAMIEPSSMIETRCLPNRSLTAAVNSSRPTSFKPTRRRGDLEVAGEDFDFMEFRLSHGDDVNFVFGFRVADRHNGSAKKAGGIKAPFAVVITGIFHRDGGPLNTRSASAKSKPCFFRLEMRLADFHVKFMVLLYIR